jgi:Flp pilus assembly CpaE family ATPase
MSNSDTTYQFQVNHQEESGPAGSGASVNSYSPHYRGSQSPDSPAGDRLSIALIGPDHVRRKEVAGAINECDRADVREFASYPPALDDVPRLLEQYHDIIIIDLDSNPEYALKLVESIYANDSATVMVYSAKADREMVVRCMRAGAREYLTMPVEQSTMAEAFDRAAGSTRPKPRAEARAQGKMLVFLGAKGGSGVTTIACNFAVALAQESGQSTLLVDLGLPMGDAALNLGIVAEYSTDNALLDSGRLDPNFLSKLLVKHRSGLFVLAAPSKVPKVQAGNEGVDKLMAVARLDFENVVVDVGSRLDLIGSALFRDAATIYLVTQAGISELRNSNRLMSQFFSDESKNLEVVINRYDPNALGVTEEHITKALTRPARWKIPDDYSAARQMQSSASSSAAADSPTSRLIRQMARSVCGLPATPDKKAGFSLRNLSKSVAEKPPSVVPAPVVAPEKLKIVWSAPAPITCGTPLSFTQLDAEASVPGTFAYMPSAGYVLPVGTHTLWVTFTPNDTTSNAPAQAAVSIVVTRSTPAIQWPAPRVIANGTALGSSQLNASASVPGTFVYTPAEGTVLTAGKHTLSATFTPADLEGYTPAKAEVQVTVATATPTIAWQLPAPITFGVAISTTQLNATASVPGIFAYSPAAGEILAAGRHTLAVTFTPSDSLGYTTAKAEVPLLVVAATPALVWSRPGPITYGTQLSSMQLDATASVPGTFAYIPAERSVLAAGMHTPSVIFTPNDSANYNRVQTAVTLAVAKATPAVSWPTPVSISDTTALDTPQLSATASVPGTFVYSPAAGEVLPAGKHTLAVTFTPMDTANYTAVQATATLSVTKTTPTTISWTSPSPVPYGTPLSSAQLNARASVPGTYVYIPTGGDVLMPGRYRLSVTFTPTDAERHSAAQATVTLVVEELQMIESTPAPAPQEPFKSPNLTNYIDLADVGQGAMHSRSTPREAGKPETRSYKGATYEKGEDGQWHLQQK